MHERRLEYEQAVAVSEAAQEAARQAAGVAERARETLIALVPDDKDLVRHPFLIADEVPEHLGIAPDSARKQMPR
ncbi:hypothetical protein [Streptomyces sp. NPDC056061]|uniref:hypothetical protein n=1 Tax=Streptomyces sp. NPDC056061 TaxID=3345700 RepID=UPI0035E01BA6